MIRISCLAFARLRINPDTFCIIVNKGREERHGEVVLSPIGGGLKYNKDGKITLDLLGAHRWEQGNDLRFRVPEGNVNRVAGWFRSRDGRERSVVRELKEELGPKESGALQPADFRGTRDQRVALNTHIQPKGSLTTYFFIETYAVQMSPSAVLRLRRAAQLPLNRRKVYIVTRSEIENGKTRDGTKIGPFARYILP